MDARNFDIESIYRHFQDDYSKEVYANRLLYSLTNDGKYILNIVKTTSEGREFISKLNNGRKKFIFGAGAWGKGIARSYGGAQMFDGFVDNRPNTFECEGLPVITFDEYLAKYRNETIIIATRLYYKELYDQLKSNDVDDALIINAGKMIDDMGKRQYFDLPELNTAKINSEIFVDAGSFDGATSLLFLDWAGAKGKRIWMLEPDSNNVALCEKNLNDRFAKKNVNRVEYSIVRLGLWNKKDTLYFQSGASGASKVAESGNASIEVDCLDNILDGKPVTFIKMDLEGSEYNALLGAKKTIKAFNPKLAISIYHKPQDVWELPSLILEMNPDYKFYLRHYSISSAETVLYAI